MMYPRPAGETPAQFLAAQIVALEYAIQDESIATERSYMSSVIAVKRAMLANLVGPLCVLCTEPARPDSACCSDAHEATLLRESTWFEDAYEAEEDRLFSDMYDDDVDCWTHTRGWFDSEQEMDAYEAHENLHNS